MTTTIGALFAGYGGLERGVQAVLGGDVAWYSEIDKGALKILTHRYPTVPNIGDITTADWTQVEPVDILTGGSPCQDLSHAGKRAGMTEGARSNLWVAMREAIARLRPGLVVWENVRGAYSADADSAVEHCPGCMGDGRPGTVLRALGRVLGDLSDLGYDTAWHGLRAADVGAPHGRFRVFAVAYPHGEGRSGGGLLDPIGRDTDGRSGAHGPRATTESAPLFPTPAVNDMGAAYTPDEWDEWTDRMKAAHGNGNGHGKSLSIEAQRLLPTPSVNDRATSNREHTDFQSLTKAAAVGGRWGDYADAIARWEHALQRPAPPPTITSSKGNPQLSPAFVEWMMGLPAGWVTDTPGITRNEALKALGNGVVPQQGEAALRILLPILNAVAA